MCSKRIDCSNFTLDRKDQVVGDWKNCMDKSRKDSCSQCQSQIDTEKVILKLDVLSSCFLEKNFYHRIDSIRQDVKKSMFLHIDELRKQLSSDDQKFQERYSALEYEYAKSEVQYFVSSYECCNNNTPFAVSSCD